MTETIKGIQAQNIIESALLIQKLEAQMLFLRYSREDLMTDGEDEQAALLGEVLTRYEDNLEEGSKYAKIVNDQLKYSIRLRRACQDLTDFGEYAGGQPPYAETMRLISYVADAALAAYMFLRDGEGGGVSNA